MSIFLGLLALFLPQPAAASLVGDFPAAEKALFMIAEAQTLPELDTVLSRLPALGLSTSEWRECQAAISRRLADLSAM